MYQVGAAIGLSIVEIPSSAFLPSPAPSNVASFNALLLLQFKLDHTNPQSKVPVSFEDSLDVLALQTAC